MQSNTERADWPPRGVPLRIAGRSQDGSKSVITTKTCSAEKRHPARSLTLDSCADHRSLQVPLHTSAAAAKGKEAFDLARGIFRQSAQVR